MAGTLTEGHLRSLGEWLQYLETLHPKAIALGLDRVREVYLRLGVRPICPVIIVAGTNGKGSTCAMLEAIYRQAHYRTGLYTSPHLERYNERVRIDGLAASDTALCGAFEAVETARQGVNLTYFEFGTLAAIWLFAQADLEVWIMEVGLGGRLDAVNVLDADLAVLTAIDLDHQEYLGATREAVGREKAGILRPGKQAVCGDAAPPQSVSETANAAGVDLWVAGHQFRSETLTDRWNYFGSAWRRYGLPLPALRGRYQIDNATTVLAALERLAPRLPVDTGAVRAGLLGVKWPARFQVLPGRPTVILDVAHNPQAARALAATLGPASSDRRTLAVFGMLSDKDIEGVVAAMKRSLDRWFVAPLPPPRGAPAAALAAALRRAGVPECAVTSCSEVAEAFTQALGAAADTDRIVIFGSFLIVAEVMRCRAASGMP